MKTNLSSQIKLERIPRRYYDPQGEIELAALTREEKIYTRIFETATAGSEYIARQIAKVIKRNVENKGKCVVTFGSGVSTHSAYAALIKLYKDGEVSFDKVLQPQRIFPSHPQRPEHSAQDERGASRPCGHTSGKHPHL